MNATSPMPTAYHISLAAGGGTDQHLIHLPTKRRQPMRGFEDHDLDIVDFIVRATHHIWAEKDIGYIYDVYGDRARVTDDVGLQYGHDRIVAGTTHHPQCLSWRPDLPRCCDLGWE